MRNHLSLSLSGSRVAADEKVTTYRVNSWVPEPRAAAKRDLYLGYLNTSPWMYFHPVSSWSSADSSSWAYLYYLQEKTEKN